MSWRSLMWRALLAFGHELTRSRSSYSIGAILALCLTAFDSAFGIVLGVCLSVLAMFAFMAFLPADKLRCREGRVACDMKTAPRGSICQLEIRRDRRPDELGRTHLWIYNYTCSTYVLELHFARRVQSVVKQVAPLGGWIHVNMKLWPTDYYRLKSAEGEDEVLPRYLRTEKVTRIDLLPRCPPISWPSEKGLRGLEGSRAKLLVRGKQFQSVPMDVAVWSRLPEDLLHSVVACLPRFSRTECKLVSKSFKELQVTATRCLPSPVSTWVVLDYSKSLCCRTFWSPVTGMVMGLCGRIEATMRPCRRLPSIEAVLQDLQAALLVVEDGTRRYQLRLVLWEDTLANGHIWLRLHEEQAWGEKEGGLRLLDCSQAQVCQGQEELKLVLVAAKLSSSHRLEWMGVWELDQASLVWRRILMQPWDLFGLECPTSVEAVVDKDLVIVTEVNPTIPAFAYHLPSRTWKVFPLRNSPTCSYRYFSSLESTCEALAPI